ncbi:NAD-dependent epimerase/dehydratase family protein [Patescibacteria group bacterium]|nr:NAD-dependent epimerase/dehydratase family protein [Patescibacteria group bacterium]
MSKQVIFEKKNVLVAGGAGFIGSHLCDELLKTSKVICVDNFSTSTESNIDHLLSNLDFVFINHDLAKPLDWVNLPDLKKFKLEFQGIQEIYNLACPMSPMHFLDNRLSVVEANSVVVKNLLDMAVSFKSKFMHFSSSVVYGPRRPEEAGIEVAEDFIGLVDNLSVRSSYDEGKRFAETMVVNYREIYSLDAKIIRLFRTYGPRMELNDDQLLPDMINNALDGKDVAIFGDERFSSSLCYIDDVIDAVIKMMNSKHMGPINIGSDVNINLTDLAMMVIKETNSESNIIYQDGHIFFSELSLPNIKKAKDELGWMPVVTLENGLKKTIFALQAQKRLQGFQKS